jgi:transcriptional regulator with XRE-family HTH domain
MLSTGDTGFKDPVDVHIGAKLREFRRARGLIQAELAHAIGSSFQQIQKYEMGGRMSAAVLYHLAHHLQVPLEDFYAGLPGRYDAMRCVGRA